MGAVNKVINAVLGVLFLPFRGMDPWVGLLVISLVSGIGLLWVFKVTSNQDAIANAKGKLKGYMLEIRLFQDDPGIVFSALGRVLWTNLVYMRYAIAPMLYLLLPVLLLLIQMDMRYGLSPMEPGEKALMTVTLKDASKDLVSDTTLELPEGVEIAAGPVRVPGEGEISWELKVTEKGLYEIGVNVGGDVTPHPLVAAGATPKVARRKPAKSFTDQFWNPGYPPPPTAAPVASIEIEYPGREMKVAGKTIHWIYTFLIVSVIFGLSVKSLFGVEI